MLNRLCPRHKLKMFGDLPITSRVERAFSNGSQYIEEQFELMRKVGIELFFVKPILPAHRFQEIINHPLNVYEVDSIRENPEHYTAVLFAKRLNGEERKILRERYPARSKEYQASTIRWTETAIREIPESDLERAIEATMHISEIHETFYILATHILGQKIDYSTKRPKDKIAA